LEFESPGLIPLKDKAYTGHETENNGLIRVQTGEIFKYKSDITAAPLAAV
jgi:hypothetical protein